MKIESQMDYAFAVQNEAEAILEEMRACPQGEWKQVLQTQLHERVQNSNEYVDNDDNAIAVLRFSKHPTYGMTSGTAKSGRKMDPSGTDQFPFASFAACALGQDVTMAVLEQLEAEGIDINNTEEDTEDNDDIDPNL